MVPVSMDCPFLITRSSCVPYVASFSGLSVLHYPFVLCTLCCQFLWIVRFWLPLRLVYPMLPVSLDCPFLITPSSCVPYVASFSGLSFLITPSSCVPYVASFSGFSDYPFVLCTLCCQFLWIVRFWLPLRLVYPMLPVSLDCQFLITPSSCGPYVASFSRLTVCITPSSCVPYVASFDFRLDCPFLITPSSCVPYVASFSGLSVLITPSSCCQFLWIVCFRLPLRLVYPMLPVSLDCPFLITPSSCVPYVASFSGLSVFDYPFVLCTLCNQFLWIVSFWLPLRLVDPMLIVSFSLVIVSFFSVFDYPFVLCTQCCQFLWIVRFWLPLRLVYPMLPVSLDCPFLITPSSCIPYVISFSGFSVFDYPFVLCTLCCQFLWIVCFWLPLRLVYPMLPVSLDCQFLITPSSCVPYVASFSGLSVFDYPFVLCTLCYQFLWIVSFWLPLRLVDHMLPVSLDCQFVLPLRCTPCQFLCVITPSYVASFSGLSVFDYPFVLCTYVTRVSGLSVSDYPFVLCTLCCQFLWIVCFWLPLRLVYPMLPVSLDCPFMITPSSCVPYVASFSGLSIFDYPFVLCTLCCQFLWIVHFWLPIRLVYPMLPVSLDCPFLITPSSCVPYVASFSG